MTERNRLLRRLATFDFAVTELHLFLDTHPNNKEIQQKLDSYMAKAAILRKEFEEKYGPITVRQQDGNNYGWISDPWPWNLDEDKKKPCCGATIFQNEIQGE